MVVRRAEDVSLPQVDAERVGAGERAVRFARGLGVGLAILFFWSCGFLLAWFVVPYVFLRERETLARRRRMQVLVSASWRWFLGLLERTTLFRAQVARPVWQGGPAVYVANHPSLLDVTAIISEVPHVCCVVKASLVESPLVGRLLRACGHVSAGDGGLMAGLAVVEELRARLGEGSSVLVFPEGTRSPKGSMHRLRRGAFEVARLAGVPVVPLFLECTPPALGKGTPLWDHPRACPTLVLDAGEPLDANNLGTAALCRTVETDFRRRLKLSEHGEAIS
jgi:1-acyl-sn-glycerol-3-phosphate acyltransferase